jgi:hypothetical protein
VSATEEYEQRLKAREAGAVRLQKIHIRLGNLRLALVIVAAAMAWGSLRGQMFSLAWLLVPALLFVAVTAHHSKILRALDLAQRAAAYYRKGLARMADQWPGTGQTGERFDDPHHVYASDLDLFRRGGLFELLSVARTRMGEETLAQWLLSPSSLDQIDDGVQSSHCSRTGHVVGQELALQRLQSRRLEAVMLEPRQNSREQFQAMEGLFRSMQDLRQGMSQSVGQDSFENHHQHQGSGHPPEGPNENTSHRGGSQCQGQPAQPWRTLAVRSFRPADQGLGIVPV